MRIEWCVAKAEIEYDVIVFGCGIFFINYTKPWPMRVGISTRTSCTWYVRGDADCGTHDFNLNVELHSYFGYNTHLRAHICWIKYRSAFGATRASIVCVNECVGSCNWRLYGLDVSVLVMLSRLPTNHCKLTHYTLFRVDIRCWWNDLSTAACDALHVFVYVCDVCMCTVLGATDCVALTQRAPCSGCGYIYIYIYILAPLLLRNNLDRK